MGRIKCEKDFTSGLIVSGDLPDRKKKREGFHQVSLFQATCPMKNKKRKGFRE
jgi:hypothetical protein